MILPRKSVWQYDFRLLGGPFPALVQNQREGCLQKYHPRRDHGDSAYRVLTISCVTSRSKGQIGPPDKWT
jgi:hypothetical protein